MGMAASIGRPGVYGNMRGPQTSVRSAGASNAGYASGGTSSYPVTGFPASAYLGNNRRTGGGQQGAGSTVSSTLGNLQQLSSKHVVLFIALLVAGGYTLWHLDNKR